MDPTSPTRRRLPEDLRTRRRTVATFESYADAERAIDRLADRHFPVERTAIVARDLSFVENITGRRGYVHTALDGLGGGALVGALFGFFFGLFNWIDPLVSALALLIYGAVFGAIVGALANLIVHTLTAGRRDFSSVAAMRAGAYDVMVDDDWADDAARVLAG